MYSRFQLSIAITISLLMLANISAIQTVDAHGGAGSFLDCIQWILINLFSELQTRAVVFYNVLADRIQINGNVCYWTPKPRVPMDPLTYLIWFHLVLCYTDCLSHMPLLQNKLHTISICFQRMAHFV